MSEATLFDMQIKIRKLKKLKELAKKFKLSDRLPIDNLNSLIRKTKGPALDRGLLTLNEN